MKLKQNEKVFRLSCLFREFVWQKAQEKEEKK